MTKAMKNTSQPNASPQPSSNAFEEITPALKSHKLLIVALFLFLFLSVIIAYLFTQNQSLKSQMGLPTFKFPWTKVTCSHEGQVYQAGESMPSADGCNSCSCTETGQVACTLMACEENQVESVLNEKNPYEDWEVYTSSIFSFKHPENYQTNETIDPGNLHVFLDDVRPELTGGDSSGNELISIIINHNDTRPISDLKQYLDDSFSFDKNYSSVLSEVGGKPAVKLMKNQNIERVYVRVSDQLGLMIVYSNRLLNPVKTQILSSFQFTENQTNENPYVTLEGKLASMERPEPDIEYDYLLQLNTPYFDELNAQGPRNITSIVVVPENETVRQTLASNIGNSLSIEGVVEWGLAETRHLKASKIVVTPDN